MPLNNPLHLVAHPNPLKSVTVYSSSMVIPVTGPVIVDGVIASAVYGVILGLL